MSNFQNYLDQSGEIGEVEEVIHTVVIANGLPKAMPGEIVVFDNDDYGQVFALLKDKVEILVLSNTRIKVGQKVTKSGKFLSVKVSTQMLGKNLTPLGVPFDSTSFDGEDRKIDIYPPALYMRQVTKEPIETGVALVDLIIPLAQGQRELIIGDRRTGKTDFLLKTMINQAQKGNICIYAMIGKRISQIKKISQTVKEKGIAGNTVLVTAQAADSAGLIFLTPYVAMTIAEFFRDLGKNVILILDDLSNHATNYRQISLLGGRFPGRNSYPGDIFYIHSKLLERAGNFKKGSITCFPVAYSVMGDLSGYTQTNFMSITDGHIFFDNELAILGRRPAINPFLSVTRIGKAPQTNLLRDVSRELSSFLLTLERLRDFIHFGAELSEEITQKLALGDRIINFFDQPVDTIPLNISLLSIGMLWIGTWRNQEEKQVKEKVKKMVSDYTTDKNFRLNVDNLIAKTNNFKDLLNNLRENNYGQQKYY